MDRISKSHRSENMSRIRSRDTKPERTVRCDLHRLGYRFRINANHLPGKPDLVLPKYRTVIFVHGCFWHHHVSCKFAYTPKTRTAFWLDKFSSNAARDSRVENQLRNDHWKVVIVWECDVKSGRYLKHLLKELQSGQPMNSVVSSRQQVSKLAHRNRDQAAPASRNTKKTEIRHL